MYFIPTALDRSALSSTSVVPEGIEDTKQVVCAEVNVEPRGSLTVVINDCGQPLDNPSGFPLTVPDILWRLRAGWDLRTLLE